MDRWRLRVAVLVAVMGAAYAVFARVALHAFPFSGDEYSYVLQAEIFARGLLHAPTPPHPELLRVDHVILQPWVCSKYPPGTSALLAIGVRLGVPWLVAPVEAVVTLAALAAAARRLLPGHDVLVAVALLGVAPLFVFEASTFFSHAATTMWISIAFAAVVAWTCDGGSWRLACAGVAVGFALVTRPFDAILFVAALLSLRSWRALIPVALGAAPFVAILLAYQAAQFGSPFVDGYAAYKPIFEAIYGVRTARGALSLVNVVDPVQMAHHLDILRAFVVDWTVPGTALLALFGWVALRGDSSPSAARRVAATLVVLFAVTLWATIGGTDDGARPRYLSTALVPLALLAAPGWRAAGEILASRIGRLACRVVGVAVWVIPLVQLGAFTLEREEQASARRGLAGSVARLGLRDAVVVVRAEYPTRYARNGPFFDGPALYVSAPRTTSVAEVAAAFPGRAVYEAHEGFGGEWLVDPWQPATP